MEDIKLDTQFERIFYKFSWVILVLFGFFIPWFLVYGLYIYGPNNSENKKRKKNVLNMTYQKFIFFYGFFFIGMIALTIILLIVLEALSLW